MEDKDEDEDEEGDKDEDGNEGNLAVLVLLVEGKQFFFSGLRL